MRWDRGSDQELWSLIGVAVLVQARPLMAAGLLMKQAALGAANIFYFSILAPWPAGVVLRKRLALEAGGCLAEAVNESMASCLLRAPP